MIFHCQLLIYIIEKLNSSKSCLPQQKLRVYFLSMWCICYTNMPDRFMYCVSYHHLLIHFGCFVKTKRAFKLSWLKRWEKSKHAFSLILSFLFLTVFMILCFKVNNLLLELPIMQFCQGYDDRRLTFRKVRRAFTQKTANLQFLLNCISTATLSHNTC